jgi:hypothetical protein
MEGSTIFWGVTPYRLVELHRHSGGKCYAHIGLLLITYYSLSHVRTCVNIIKIHLFI